MPKTRRIANDDVLDQELSTASFGERGVAEYIVFLLALDTYQRYLAEHDMEADDVSRRGIALVRTADRLHADFVQSEIARDISLSAHRKMLDRAFKFLPTRSGLASRTINLRTILSRGGTVTMRAIFQTNKALAAVREAIQSSMMDDADAALDKFVLIPMRNIRLRDWIAQAAKQAGSGTFQNATALGSQDVADDADRILKTRIQQAGKSLTSTDEADSSKDELAVVQVEATEAASRAMEVSGEADVPPTRSEVVGIATAAAVAVATDPSRELNIPEPLRKLDDEQRAAALTDGRVLVAAGAGAGKSTTLVSRIKYLVQEQKVNPNRILACSFNAKAAAELKEKIAKSLGTDSNAGVRVGTMHTLFKEFITGSAQNPGFGTPEERAMLAPPRLIAPPRGKSEGFQGKSISPTTISTTIRNMWNKCDPEVLARMAGGHPVKWFAEGAPKAKKCNLYITKWRGNDISLEQAKASVRSKAEAQAVVWYEFYLGLKGDLPNWRPPVPLDAFTNFMGKHRRGGERLGDLDDMVKVFRDILARDPKARAAVQSSIDHFLVDECQDLNNVQHQIFEMMSEHIQSDTKGKSIWMVGDDKQAIYQFRGARPELFVGLNGKEGWKTRMIRTNYRCEPEIVEAANRLVAHNEGQIPMEARANPTKPRGQSRISVETPFDNTDAAIQTIGRIRKDIDLDGAKAEDYAVLARTNAELNDFETACIINEIHYVRKGGKGFLDAPESKAVLGYIDLVQGTDFARKRESLISTLMKPDRGLYLSPDAVAKQVDEAIDAVARMEGLNKNTVNPLMLLGDRYIGLFADILKQPYKKATIEKAQTTAKGEYAYKMRVRDLASNLSGLKQHLSKLEKFLEDSTRTTDELLDFILDNMTSTVSGWDPVRRQSTLTTTSLRDQITSDMAIFSDEEEVEEEEGTGEVGEDGQMVVDLTEKAKAGLGAVRFLYELSKSNAMDEKYGTDPNLAQGFVSKLNRYTELAGDLRIDPEKFAAEQERIADPGKRRNKPPAVTLATVHSVKGAEWKNVSVLMPKGMFPMESKPKEGDPPPDPVEAAALLKAERNLAYVALTRAAVNLEVLCPKNKGISTFVGEAGLVVGENVEKSTTKTAALADLDTYHVSEILALYGGGASYSYGRS